jgi:hypothetical protein
MRGSCCLLVSVYWRLFPHLVFSQLFATGLNDDELFEIGSPKTSLPQQKAR